MRRPIVTSLVVGAGLCTAIGVELAPDRSAEPARPIEVASRTLSRVAPTTAASSAIEQTILLRPLFEPGRRPPRPTAAAAVAPSAFPRLTGTMVTAAARTAIFAIGARQVVVSEGGRLDGWTVAAIGAGTATLRGVAGTRAVAVAFGPWHKPDAPAVQIAASWQVPRDEAAATLYGAHENREPRP